MKPSSGGPELQVHYSPQIVIFRAAAQWLNIRLITSMAEWIGIHWLPCILFMYPSKVVDEDMLDIPSG